MLLKKYLILSLLFLPLCLPAHGHENEVSITVSSGLRCVEANGLPDHATGRFPNNGNPNSIRKQGVHLCVPVNPKKESRPTPVEHGSIGVALNGVQIRPSTTDYYDPSSRRGFSRNSSSGWNLEGLGARNLLGMDNNNAHVDRMGLYHYHGVAKALLATSFSSLIGYAADGFEIHYAGNGKKSSYQLKSGYRPSAPGGRYDGTYNEDWEYVQGSGSLDACNAGTLNGTFVYFATDRYPFFPRCLWGEPSRDFMPRRGGRQAIAGGENIPGFSQANRPQDDRHRFGPPPQAVSACENQQRGASCSFKAPNRDREVSGFCGMTPNGVTACMPR